VRNKFADKAAGWAHSVLFAAELPQFRSLLPTTLQQEMKIYSEQRKLLNKEKKLQSKTASSALLLSASSSLPSLSVPSSSLIKKRVRMKTMKVTRKIIVHNHDINGTSKSIARYDNDDDDDDGVVAINIENELSP
jgi:hypothetical protein